MPDFMGHDTGNLDHVFRLHQQPAMDKDDAVGHHEGIVLRIVDDADSDPVRVEASLLRHRPRHFQQGLFDFGITDDRCGC